MKSTQIIAACVCLFCAAAGAETLTITVSGLQAGEGNLRIAVFDKARRDQFPEGQFLYGLDFPAGENEMTVEIAGVKAGQYALAAYQDANQNQQLDRDADNIVAERYGFSTHTGNRQSTFEEALFDTKEAGYELSIELRSADRSATAEQ